MTEQKMNLRQKLFEIQKSIQTFANTEESEKKANGSRKSAYNYCPGWKIVESIREMMDKYGIMLETNMLDSKHTMIEYNVYKEIGSAIMPFQKREMYVTVKQSFTWVDVNTGEMVGPFINEAAGANGTDKSMASAISFNERYFLLKYFHITTREKEDEPDAHDSSSVPGDIANRYKDAKEVNIGAPQPINMQMNQSQQVPPQYQQPMAPQQYYPQQQYQQMPSQQQYQQQMSQPQIQAPSYAPEKQYNNEQENMTAEETYSLAITDIAQFAIGTNTYDNKLAYWMTQLNLKGYDTSNPDFKKTLEKNVKLCRQGYRK